MRVSSTVSMHFHRPIIFTFWSETPIAFIDDAAMCRRLWYELSLIHI